MNKNGIVKQNIIQILIQIKIGDNLFEFKIQTIINMIDFITFQAQQPCIVYVKARNLSYF